MKFVEWLELCRLGRHLRAYMKQLRAKIELQPGKPKYLLTEPWAGYQLRVPE